MEYAKYINEHEVDTNIPTTVAIDGVVYSGSLITRPDLLKRIGFLPVEEIYPDPPTKEGYHLEPTYAEDDENERIVATYEFVEDPPPPPKSYSKLKILLAAQNAGMGEAFVGLLQSNSMLKLIWDASNTIEENSLLDQYLPSIALALGKTEEQVKDFLNENCVID